jgi:hypothetical protein
MAQPLLRGGAMKTSHVRLACSILFAIALAATAACDTDAPAATTATDDAPLADARTSVPSAYLVVRADQRRCASPMCGGFFVQRANYGTTRCADGVYRSECYVATISYDALGLQDGERDYLDGRVRAGLTLVKGKVASKSYSGFGNLGVLNVSEAWDGLTEQAPVGALHLVASTGIVCISAPCPTLHATQLNRSARDQQITGLDLSALTAADDVKDDAMNAAYTNGLVVAGEIETCAGNEVVLRATAVFKKLEHKVQLAGDWSFTASNRSEYHFSLAQDGTFTVQQLPGCLFARPACAIKMALLSGTWSFDGHNLHLVYTSAVRNGETADFVVSGQGSSLRLVGADFGTTLRLAKQ